jgi:hypothetical protein
MLRVRSGEWLNGVVIKWPILAALFFELSFEQLHSTDVFVCASQLRALFGKLSFQLVDSAMEFDIDFREFLKLKLFNKL